MAATRSRLCTPCRDELAGHLSGLPALYLSIERDRTPGIPLSPAAATTRSAIRGVLATWAHVVVGGRAVPRPVRSVTELADFLLRHVDWLGAHPAAAEAAAEIGDLAALLRHPGRTQRAGELAA
jgi:hypothetical protein